MKNTLQLKSINSATAVLKCEHFDINFKLIKLSGCEGWHITSGGDGGEGEAVKSYGLSRLTKEEAWGVVADMFGANIVLK